MNYFIHEANPFPAISTTDYTNLTASWSSYGSGNHRPAILVDGKWYVSNATIGGGSGGTGSTIINTVNFVFDTASWRMLDLTPGLEMALSTDPAISTSTLFSNGDPITGFGYYATLGTPVAPSPGVLIPSPSVVIPFRNPPALCCYVSALTHPSR